MTTALAKTIRLTREAALFGLVATLPCIAAVWAANHFHEDENIERYHHVGF